MKHAIIAGLVPAAVLLLSQASGPQAQAAPAGGATTAATCQHVTPHNNDSGTGKVRSGLSSAAIHTGPNAGCDVTGYAFSGETLAYWCFVTNSSGNTWTYVRDTRSEERGWIYDANLNDGGSSKFCA